MSINKKKGFSLIELLSVISIIGILVLLAAPNFSEHIKNAKTAQVKQEIFVLENRITEWITLEDHELTEWPSIDSNMIKDIAEDNKLFNKKGKVNEITGDSYFMIDNSFLEKYVKSDLEGDFYVNNEVKVYYSEWR